MSYCFSFHAGMSLFEFPYNTIILKFFRFVKQNMWFLNILTKIIYLLFVVRFLNLKVLLVIFWSRQKRFSLFIIFYPEIDRPFKGSCVEKGSHAARAQMCSAAFYTLGTFVKNL